MTSMTTAHPLPKVSEVYARFPVELIKHLRQVVEAASPSDAFACHCNLLEWLTNYLNSLANSVYLARSIDDVDESVEKRLRAMPNNPPFGLSIDGLRTFTASNIDFESALPELKEILSAKQLPTACGRLAQAFKLIQHAREELEVPPRRLERYLAQHLPADNSLSKCNLDRFLNAISPFRNKGHGHQAEETWFPRDPSMYKVALAQLNPAVDELLTWQPFCELLSRYEVVRVESAQVYPRAERRACAISRPRVTEGLAPLGGSVLLLTPGQHAAPEGTQFIARRTDHLDELEVVVRHVRFPRALQSSELLAQRYAEIYLHAYLDHGLITPTQRQTKLAPKLAELALSERDWKRVESEIQEAINNDSSEDPSSRSQTLGRLAAMLGPRWSEHEARIAVRLDELLTRRKDYIFEQIENNVIMSIDQLRRESELSEPDVRDVLIELEQEDRVRPLQAGAQNSGYFKAQDPSKTSKLRAILAELRDSPRRGKKAYPAPVWRLLNFCAELLIDDGLPLADGELQTYAELFAIDVEIHAPELDDDDGKAMTLRIDGSEITARTVRELLTAVWRWISERGLDTAAVVPLLMGKSRYLLAHEPIHANGTPFKNPFEIDTIVFEGNLGRTRAIVEMLRLLRKLGVEATSPDSPIIGDVSAEIDDDAPVELEAGGYTEFNEDDGFTELKVWVTAPAQREPTLIQGPTVRRFYSALLGFLVRQNAPLKKILPVATGRVRYLLNDEPYHDNDRPFDSMIQVGEYYMCTAYTYDQALNFAKLLLDKLGWLAEFPGRPSDADSEDGTPLTVTIGNVTIDRPDVPSFLREVVLTLFATGILRAQDVPYKSGRVRYLISETATHDHGRDFIRPVEIEVDGRHYFIETNVSRKGAVDLAGRLLAGRQTAVEVET